MTIYTSRFAPVALSTQNITQRVFAGLGDAPDRPILIDGPTGRTLTVAQANQQVRALAGGLRARGIGPGSMVAIMAPNCPEYFVVFHAVAWAGATITTINPTYTAPEVHHQLTDSGAQMVFTVAAALPIVSQAVAGTGVTQIIALDGDDAPAMADIMGPEMPEPEPVDVASHVAALPYSSGTTGLPKGVMLTHRNLVVNIDQVLAAVQVRADDTVVSFLPFFHIYGMQVLMNTYLAAGGTVVTMPRFDLEQFLILNARHKSRRMYVVPPVAVALAKHPLVDQHPLPALQFINSGAAPLGGDVTEAVGRRLGAQMVQGFGMTELSPVSHTSTEALFRAGASGTALPNTESRIIDPENGRDVPPGETGELWVRGPQVMKGYHNNPAATAATLDADGWLHTGDIGHIDADGFLTITDRLKELIKVKGFQVAPAELEALLLTHPAITDCAVIGVPDEEAGEVPMAFVTGANPPDLAAVQAHLAPHIVSYKQVRHLRVLDAIPKSASGKILRRVLRKEQGVLS